MKRSRWWWFVDGCHVESWKQVWLFSRGKARRAMTSACTCHQTTKRHHPISPTLSTYATSRICTPAYLHSRPTYSGCLYPLRAVPGISKPGSILSPNDTVHTHTLTHSHDVSFFPLWLPVEPCLPLDCFQSPAARPVSPPPAGHMHMHARMCTLGVATTRGLYIQYLQYHQPHTSSPLCLYAAYQRPTLQLMSDAAACSRNHHLFSLSAPDCTRVRRRASRPPPSATSIHAHRFG